MTQDLFMLTADEKLLVRQYRLEEYFQNNKNHVSFVMEMKEILDKRFNGITRSDWAKDGFISLAKNILECCDPLFEYVNTIHARRHGGANIPREEWKRLCHISSKIIVHVGWLIVQ